MQIDVDKYVKYKNALRYIKDAKNYKYTTFREMIRDLQNKATRALED